ncbi:hypothetical protein [Microbacterium sp. E-13]|uniref:hypothetical protein n=1 Tax=Microbacterium sp. E-13 TaxID=3404048 RepID=UPI003CE67F2B
MSDEISQSVALVIATALATGIVSLAAAWQQHRFAERRAAQERNAALADERRAATRDHALRLHEVLNDLNEVGRRFIQNGGAGIPHDEEIRELYRDARNHYLLVPDSGLRSAIADALTVVIGGRLRAVAFDDWQEATAAAAFIVAAYLRGDALPDRYVGRLRELRAEYAPDAT